MAGDWIKMRGNLWDDPRIAALVDATETSEAAVIGGLYWLWATADQHTEDGLMPGLTLRQIDRKTGVAGLGKALCDIGWLAERPEGVCLENFTEHNGASAKRRASEAQRKANSRKPSASDADKSQTSNGHEPEEIRQVAELEKEKRREEIDNSVAIATGGSAASLPAELPKDELWKAGKSLLMQAGMPTAQCGSFVGKLVKDYGEGVVVEAVRAAVVARPADPAQYLKAACMRAVGKRSGGGGAVAGAKQQNFDPSYYEGAGNW
ncbi:hypothetical protein HNP33_002053 [Comamonas odontotermitis]|uniref:Uncharacterized protein n=1 Tax=Comamonas odontotermitis TaxID=379895 RepID=A0ABR6RFQ1_9BURK|nr:hypothetical protein [Comamonas odontotermitis]MBB6577985.1 hypothetical protein [Comamonas odontotermitis]